ncbi:TonB-dependent receptor [Zymomonas mobilis]|uniref:TonB-dependent siderophore receptor n=1 Tax=Zymomonas mobilis subsp. mobilis (strain ATCC 10988 / DSM 424 / LMG 404 / NCIMB 8938 / NRRL B-806 / ZM1) TaxID=555217 RepID=A0A0H3FZ92_ZYMMA|nr:TonB-dependent siderophore receptor [Zymomonas mobilis]AEH63155.1 TonB-dependent siderophore receptor [Zymomonas mobilis subsp. mobilis ATCC 10988]TQL27232.1 iron complex outermembrane receptor protein/catecholate siderophore receptor [Zymomonas mobilis]TQL28662.1 iron complex outermembrane receptor protein/catecholate siderophore receptor [Zymomonas mobilis]
MRNPLQKWGMLQSGTCLVALLLSSPSHAAKGKKEDPADLVITAKKDSDDYGQKRNTAAKIDIANRDLPQTVNTVSAQLMRDQMVLSQQDALKNVPGVSFSTGDGQRDQVFIRGFNAFGDEFVNGFRDDALYFRDMSNIENIEVLKGPSAALFGRGSAGGIVNRVTKQADTNITNVTFTGGSWNDYRGQWDFGRNSKRTGNGFRLTGAIENGDSYRDQQFVHRFAIAPSFMYGKGTDTVVTFQADYLKDRRIADLGNPSLNGRTINVDHPEIYYGSADAAKYDYTQSTVFSQTINAVHHFSDNLSLRDGFRHYDYKMFRGNTSPASGVVDGLVQLSHHPASRDESGWDNQLELTQKIDSGKIHQTLLYGFEVSRQSKLSTTYATYPGKNASAAEKASFYVDAYNPVLPTITGDDLTSITNQNRGIFYDYGLYIQDAVDFSHGFKLLAGIRWDSFSQTTLPLAGSASYAHRLDHTWSPRVGLTYEPDNHQSYYISWSKSYQPSGETLNIVATQADLIPSATTSKEIGAKYNLWHDRLTIQIAGFIIKKTHIQATNPLDNSTMAIGTQRNEGAEFSATLDVGKDIHLIAGYAYLRTKNLASAVPAYVGKEGTLAPHNQGNFYITKSFGKHFGIGGGMNYVGNRWADPSNTVILPHYVTGDAMGWAQFGRYRFQINAYNLSNAHYVVSGHGTNANLNMPGAPLNFRGTISVSL